MNNKPFIPPPPSGLKKENIGERRNVENNSDEKVFSSQQTLDENKIEQNEENQNINLKKRKKLRNFNKSNLINWVGFSISTAALILFVYLLFI